MNCGKLQWPLGDASRLEPERSFFLKWSHFFASLHTWTMAPMLLVLFWNRAFLRRLYFEVGRARSGILRWSSLVLQMNELFLVLNHFHGYVRIVHTFDEIRAVVVVVDVFGLPGHRLRQHASLQLAEGS